jgi:hypothetical protein
MMDASKALWPSSGSLTPAPKTLRFTSYETTVLGDAESVFSAKPVFDVMSSSTKL